MQPARSRAIQPVSHRVPATTAAAHRPSTTGTTQGSTATTARVITSTTRVPARPIPRESTLAPGTSGGASQWLTFDHDKLEPLPEPISQPQSRSTPRTNTPSNLRAPRAANGTTRFNVELGESAPPQAGARAGAEADRFGRDLGGPAPGVPPRVRPYVPYTDLVHDRAEEFAVAEARANGRQVPNARNYNGDERMMIPFTAKYHFGLMLIDNPYGNRIYSRETAKDAFEEQWARILPHKELRMPDDEYFNLLVNRGATSRCDARNRIRPVAQTSCGFTHPARTREDLQYNQGRVATLLPNKFHYGSLDPPTNPYGNIDISRALGAGLFHSPTAVGVVHRELFGPLMPLQVIAFILTYFQVCAGEFTTGRYEAIDLNAAAQYQIYISYCRGLQAYEQRAPNRMHLMQTNWFKYAMAFAGIDDDDEGQAQAPYQDVVPLEDIRPDTPEPNTCEAPEIPEVEIDAAQSKQIRYDENGWQQYTNEDLYGDNQDEPTAEFEHEFEQEEELEPEPEPDLDDSGRLTARAKGKGRAAPGPSRRARR
ncbi:hypothetical protein BDV93DRAFT_39938 [Ceratobasidium sp. AG-I]|nr:hypothetical protein BDV93DRAFT_39938 [Ceratobasidium sp. AG-I]